MSESQLARLAKPFPAKYVTAAAPGKFGSYVTQAVVVQKLLAVVGPFDLDVGQVFFGDEGRIEGCLVTITCEVDGRRVSITEVGDCEQPTNWKTQGARMKDAISDGIKRCAARLGVGLHLYKGEFFLYDQLSRPASAGERQETDHTAVETDASTSPPPSDAAVLAQTAAASPDTTGAGRAVHPAPAPAFVKARA